MSHHKFHMEFDFNINIDACDSFDRFEGNVNESCIDRLVQYIFLLLS